MLLIVCETRSLLAERKRRWFVDESCWGFEGIVCRWMTTDKAGAGWGRVNAAAIRKKGPCYLHVIGNHVIQYPFQDNHEWRRRTGMIL
jgi:hypothetical protein